MTRYSFHNEIVDGRIRVMLGWALMAELPQVTDVLPEVVKAPRRRKWDPLHREAMAVAPSWYKLAEGRVAPLRATVSMLKNGHSPLPPGEAFEWRVLRTDEEDETKGVLYVRYLGKIADQVTSPNGEPPEPYVPPLVNPDRLPERVDVAAPEPMCESCIHGEHNDCLRPVVHPGHTTLGCCDGAIIAGEEDDEEFHDPRHAAPDEEQDELPAVLPDPGDPDGPSDGAVYSPGGEIGLADPVGVAPDGVRMDTEGLPVGPSDGDPEGWGVAPEAENLTDVDGSGTEVPGGEAGEGRHAPDGPLPDDVYGLGDGQLPQNGHGDGLESPTEQPDSGPAVEHEADRAEPDSGAVQPNPETGGEASVPSGDLPF
jgi:hypothetical protein